jgi:hypothetical protein
MQTQTPRQIILIIKNSGQIMEQPIARKKPIIRHR